MKQNYSKECRAIKNLLKKNGYDVKGVQAIVDDNYDPGVSFKILISDKKLVGLLRNYAWNVTMVNY